MMATDDSTPDRRARLMSAVANLATAIERGDVEPTSVELSTLALICDEQDLPAEAARVRRWLGETQIEAWLARTDRCVSLGRRS